MICDLCDEPIERNDYYFVIEKEVNHFLRKTESTEFNCNLCFYLLSNGISKQDVKEVKKDISSNII